MFHVSDFPENTYFPERKIFLKCLVAFQKMLWKIFFGVWLCCWKYHRKHIFYLLLTFSHIFLAAKQIYNFIPQSRNTNKTQKKKFIIRSRLGSTRGKIVRSRSVLRSRSAQRRDRDRGRRSGSRTIQRRGWGWRSGSRTIGFGVQRSRGQQSESGSFGFSGFFLSLSLSLCARARLPLTQLSLCFPENGYLKVK